jgi:thioredoxin-dependent peroxiredoxin
VCSLRSAAEDLEALGATVYGASLDDVASQARFVKEQELTFPLLSDPDGSAAAKYGVLMAERGFSARVTFFVDPEGVLRHVDRSVKPDTHGADVLETLKRLRP